MANLTVYEFIEDFDNNELPPDDWREQLLEAVVEYNKQYNTTYDPRATVTEYCRKKSKLDDL